MSAGRGVALTKKSQRSVTYALARGYVAWGYKYCWGNYRWYDAGLHRSLADAQESVENLRREKYGMKWHIHLDPICVARNAEASLAFSVSIEHSLPVLSREQRFPGFSDLLLPGDNRPRASIESNSADSMWQECTGPWLAWDSESFGGSLKLHWRETRQEGSPAPRARKWISRLSSRRALRRQTTADC